MPDMTQEFLVKKCLSGLRKSRPQCDSRLPVTLALLEKFSAALPSVCSSSDFQVTMTRAMFALSFFAICRSGEVTGKCPVLQRSDLSLPQGDHSMTIKFRNYKHNTGGRPFSLEVRCYCSKTTCCPGLLMRRYLVARRRLHSGQGVIFLCSEGKPVTKRYFGAILKACCCVVGPGPTVGVPTVPPGSYSSHSFRIGGASWAESLGLSEQKS